MSFTGRTELEFVTSVVPVLEQRSGVIAAMGTAFFVSQQGILLTARHVIDGMFGDDPSPGEHFGEPGHFFFVLVPGGPVPEAISHRESLRVTHISLEPRKSDIAILRVDMSSFPLETLPHLKPWPLAHYRPTLGEECAVFGYAEMAVGQPVDPTGASPDLAWTQRVAAESGLVGNQYPSGRDRSLAPYPCFEVLVPTSPGMSGGPVFTDNGLGGVVSVGTTGEEGLEPYSLAALIASCYQLGLQFDLGDGMREHMLNDVIAGGGIVATGPATGMRDLGDRFEVVWL